MRPEIEAFLNSAPTYFDLTSRPSEERLKIYDLPFSLEDLVLECAEQNLAVTSLISDYGKGTLRVHEPERDYSFIDHPYIDDKGAEGLKIIDTEITKLRRLLAGSPREVEYEDLNRVYERESERLSGLLMVSLLPNVGFGEFIEDYPTNDRHYLTDATYEWEDFAQDFEIVALEPGFYGQLERYLKRRDLIKKHQMIDPVARFSQINGNLILEISGEDIYFWEFIELNKDPDGANAIGFMRTKGDQFEKWENVGDRNLGKSEGEK